MESNYTIEELPQIAQSLVTQLNSKLVLLYGEMGIGKTTLIKEIAKQLGVKESMQSPSYGIVNEYDIQGKPFYHIDLYRLNSLEEALDFGIEEYLNEDTWCFIEWPQLIESIVDVNHEKIKIVKNKNRIRTVRKITLTLK